MSLRVDLVISVCDQDCGNVPIIIDSILQVGRLAQVRMYEKCGANYKCRRFSNWTESLLNVGRCDHTFAHDLAKRTKGDADVIVYGKDSMLHIPPSRVPAALKLRSMLRDATRRGIGCVLRHTDTPSHFTFPIPHSSYVRWGHKWQKHIPPPESDQAQFAPPDNLNTISMWWRALNISIPRKFVVCYTGTFAVDGTSVPGSAIFVTIERLLSRGDSIRESHYMERTWGILFDASTIKGLARHDSA